MCKYETDRSAVLLHGMSHLVVLVLSALTGEETGLAHVEVETLQATVTEALKVKNCNYALTTEALSVKIIILH